MQVCKEYGIVLTAYSPFAGSPQTIRQNEEGEEKYAPHKKTLWDNEVVKKLADKYDKKVSQILLKFHVQRGVVVIPKSVTKERIIENSNIFDFELTDDELASLTALKTGERLVALEPMKSCKEFPFNEE